MSSNNIQVSEHILPTPVNWHWSITPEQVIQIKQGNRDTINKVYFDNLKVFKSMSYKYCLKWQYNLNFAQDAIQQIYVDLPTYDYTNIRTFAKGLYKSMRFAIRCGQEFTPLSIDKQLGAGKSRHQDDKGGTLADTLSINEEMFSVKEREEMEHRIDEICERAKGVQRIALYCIAYGNNFTDGVQLYGKNKH